MKLTRREFAKLSSFAVMFALLACVHPQWHKATRAEYNAEYNREVTEMAKFGMAGDPPISMGMMLINAGTDIGLGDGWGEEPGYYTDGRGHFRTRYWINKNGVTIEYRTYEEFEKARKEQF